MKFAKLRNEPAAALLGSKIRTEIARARAAHAGDKNGFRWAIACRL